MALPPFPLPPCPVGSDQASKPAQLQRPDLTANIAQVPLGSFGGRPTTNPTPLGSRLPAQPVGPGPWSVFVPEEFASIRNGDRANVEKFLKETSDRANGRLAFAFRDSSQAGQYVVSIYYQGNYQHNLLTSEQFANWPGILRFYNLSMGSPYFVGVIRNLSSNIVTSLSIDNVVTIYRSLPAASELSINISLLDDGVNLNLSILEQSIMAYFIKLNRSITNLRIRLDKTGQTFCPTFFEALEELSTLTKIQCHEDGVSIPQIVRILQKATVLRELELPYSCSEATEKIFVDALAANLKLTSLQKIFPLKSTQDSIVRSLAQLRSRNPQLEYSIPVPGSAFLEAISKYSASPSIHTVNFILREPPNNPEYFKPTTVDGFELTICFGAQMGQGNSSCANLSAVQQQKLAEVIRKGFNTIQKVRIEMAPSALYRLEPCVILAWESKSKLKEITYACQDHVVIMSAVLRSLTNLERFSAPHATQAMMHEFIVALAANNSLTTLESVTEDRNQTFLPATGPYLEILKARNSRFAQRDTLTTFDEIAKAFQTYQIREICFECIGEGSDPKYCKIPRSGVTWDETQKKLEIYLGLETKLLSGTTVTALTLSEQMEIADMIKKCASLESFRVWVYDKATYLIEGFVIETMMHRKIHRLTVNCENYIEETSNVLRCALSLFALNWGHCPSKRAMSQYLEDIAENTNITGLAGIDSLGWAIDEEHRLFLLKIIDRNKYYYNGDYLLGSLGNNKPLCTPPGTRPQVSGQILSASPILHRPGESNLPQPVGQPLPGAASSGLGRPLGSSVVAQPHALGPVSPVPPRQLAMPAESHVQSPQPTPPLSPSRPRAAPVSPVRGTGFTPPVATVAASPEPSASTQNVGAGIGLSDALGSTGAGFEALPSGMIGTTAVGLRIGAFAPRGNAIVQRSPSPSSGGAPLGVVQPRLPQQLQGNSQQVQPSLPPQMSFTNYTQL